MVLWAGTCPARPALRYATDAKSVNDELMIMNFDNSVILDIGTNFRLSIKF